MASAAVEEHLTHDLPCTECGHGPHSFFDCGCGCSHPPTPGLARRGSGD